MRNLIGIQLAGLALLPTSAMAQDFDPYSYVKRLPSDCEDVREMMNMKTGKMEFLYVASCNRAGFSSFSRLEGVTKVSPSVIMIPIQEIKADPGPGLQMINGHYCSGLPAKPQDSVAWICQSTGWTSD